MQLEACLRSFKENFIDLKELPGMSLSVIYRASEKDFQMGYEKVKKLHPEFNFINQGATGLPLNQPTIASILDANPYTMFLVDDIIFKSKFSLKDSIFERALNKNIHMLAASLRLYKGITKCYALSTDTKLPTDLSPRDNQEYLTWKWQGCEGDWGYPFSLDGNIYNTDFIKSIISCLPAFQNPNMFEVHLNAKKASLGKLYGYMSCYEGESKLINIPTNRVQVLFNNRFEETSDIHQLNDLFVNHNKRISLGNTTRLAQENISVHCPIVLQLENMQF
jgi:hypothetical protein